MAEMRWILAGLVVAALFLGASPVVGDHMTHTIEECYDNVNCGYTATKYCSGTLAVATCVANWNSPTEVLSAYGCGAETTTGRIDGETKEASTGAVKVKWYCDVNAGTFLGIFKFEDNGGKPVKHMLGTFTPISAASGPSPQEQVPLSPWEVFVRLRDS